MTTQSRSNKWFLFFMTIGILYGIALFILGVQFLQDWLQNHDIGWQRKTLPILSLSFLPLVILGGFYPRLAAILFWSGSALCVMQVVCITRSTGEGTAIAAVSAVVFLGIPMLLAGLLFWTHPLSKPHRDQI